MWSGSLAKSVAKVDRSLSEVEGNDHNSPLKARCCNEAKRASSWLRDARWVALSFSTASTR